MDDVYQFIIFSWVDKIKASIKFEWFHSLHSKIVDRAL
jgi:hypothetical protein